MATLGVPLREYRFPRPKSWIKWMLAYRIPVYVLTFLLIIAPLRYRYVAAHPEVLVVALCFSSLMAFIYLFNKVTDHHEDSINLQGGPIAVSMRNPVLVLSFACLLVPLFYLAFFPAYLPWYGALAFLGYFYSKPFPFTRPPVRLKGVLFIKNITAALGWALPSSGVYTVIIPHYSPTDFWFHFLALFCFSLMVELLWDVRDMEGDKVAGVHTIANTFGVVTTQVFALVLLAVFLLLFGITKHPYLSALVAVISILFIAGTNPCRRAWFYHSILGMWIGVLIAGFCI